MNATLKEIWIYPVKSLPGISLDMAAVTEKGLEMDRRFMLTDSSGRFISLRERKDLYRFELSLQGDSILISHPNQPDTLRIHPFPSAGVETSVEIWDDKVTVIEPDTTWSSWFSRALGDSCRLVYMPDNSGRMIKSDWHTGMDTVSFADGYAFLAVGESSLNSISSESGIEIDVRRFRPNLVVSGSPAYDEFYWDKMTIGKVLFQGLKPCERCLVTTIDPVTFESGKEPLRSLASRKINDKVVFGQHLSAANKGTIRLGDPVEVVSRKDSPYDPV